jgi:hypothetical protein
MRSTRLVQVRLPVDLAIKLRVIAATLDRSVNDILGKLVEDFVAKHSGSLGIRRTARIDKEDIPELLRKYDEQQETALGKVARRRRTKEIRQ